MFPESRQVALGGATAFSDRGSDDSEEELEESDDEDAR
jgi:hypothetical protein